MILMFFPRNKTKRNTQFNNLNKDNNILNRWWNKYQSQRIDLEKKSQNSNFFIEIIE